jgi:hypothetical protein
MTKKRAEADCYKFVNSSKKLFTNHPQPFILTISKGNQPTSMKKTLILAATAILGAWTVVGIANPYRTGPMSHVCDAALAVVEIPSVEPIVSVYAWSALNDCRFYY